ncbi:MAG TPA: DUF4173 domain-containing protein [Pyrinomonadaceae bacterium]|nr:DUF4173 domain-containing protein [Pyrinomonadaceae bacterium]HMP66638.1 DUF4173 domain-containing protein [Pyrinomonadaceae bacterium]
MNNRTKAGLEILMAAAVIGLLGNILLRQTPWGLNAFLFVTAFTAAMAFVMFRNRPELMTVRTLALQAAMVFFGAMFLIRDSIELRVYDTVAIIVIMGVLVLPNFGVDQRIAGVIHYAGGLAWAGISSLFAPFLLIGADIDWKKMPGDRLSTSIFSGLRGLAVAAPLIIVFGALFMAADAAYEGWVNGFFSFDAESAVSHVLLSSFLAWLAAGYLRGAVIDNVAAAAFSAGIITSPIPPFDTSQDNSNENTKDAASESDASFVEKFSTEPADGPSLPNNVTVLEHINISDPPNADPGSPSSEGEVDAASPDGVAAPAEQKRDWQNWDNSAFPQVFTLGRVETVIILGLLNILFLSFVVFQLPYLFGGMDFVQNTPDLKLADFARRGFGELVTVAFLVLPMLLVSHWLLRRDSPSNETIFRVLAGVQIGLLFVIMASAMQRLVLLTGSLGYGWTTVRFYPMVVMIWLAVVFVWFGWTVLRGKRQNFAWGALWSAIVILAATNLMNPDDFIARKNIQLMQEGRDYDAYYNTAELSDDAVPVVAESLSLMNQEDRCRTMAELYQRLIGARGEDDIRSFNWSRETAYKTLESNSGVLANGPGCEDYRPAPRKFLGEYGR